MKTFEITDDNMDSFLPILGEDRFEDLKRIYYRGIGVTDDNSDPVGVMVCELANADNEEDTRGRICFLKSKGKEIFEAINSYYTDCTVYDEMIAVSEYELSDESEAKELSEAGYSSEKKESDTIIFTLGEVMESRLGKLKKIPGYINNIGGLSILDFREAVKKILFKGHKGALEGIPYLPMNWFDDKISSCVMSDNLVPGLFLIRRNPSGTLLPVFYSAYGVDANKNLLYMLEYSFQKAVELYPPETRVLINRHNASTHALVDKLFPGHMGDQVFCGMRKEK